MFSIFVLRFLSAVSGDHIWLFPACPGPAKASCNTSAALSVSTELQLYVLHAYLAPALRYLISIVCPNPRLEVLGFVLGRDAVCLQ